MPRTRSATHYLGLAAWQRGDLQEGEARMRASLALDASIPDFHNNLGLLLRDTRRATEAVEEFRATLRVDPGWIEAYSNLGLTLEVARALGRSHRRLSRGVARQPQLAVARQNLARALLDPRRARRGLARIPVAAPRAGRESPPRPILPRPLARIRCAGRSFALVAEQGLGDILFFLRFAPELVERGARLAFRGDARLHSMLARTGLFELGIGAPDASSHRRASRRSPLATFRGCSA